MSDDPIHELMRLARPTFTEADETAESLARLEDIGLEMFRTQQRLAKQRRDARRPDGRRYVKKPSHNAFIREAAHIHEPLQEAKRPAELWISYSPLRAEALRIREMPELKIAASIMDPDALNGYVWFPKRHAPALPVDTHGIVKYIPVHGGVTYACKDATGVVYGFDTGHFNSEKLPRTDPDWMRYQCHVLYMGLEVAAELWPEYRRAGFERRKELASKVFEVDEAASGTVPDRLGFEALLSLLCGRI